ECEQDRVFQPPLVPQARNGSRPPGVPRAAGRHRRPVARDRRRRRAGPARGAARLAGRPRTRARPPPHRLDPGPARKAGRARRGRRPRVCADRPGHVAEPPHLGRHPARRGRGPGRHRRGDGRRAAERLLRGAPSRPPRLPQPRHGVLHLQQCGRRRPLRAGAARAGAGGDRRLRRAPRQRHRGYFGQRRAHADGRHLPIAVLSVQRRPTPGPQHGQPAGARVHQGPADPRADRAALDAAAGSLQAPDDLHQRRLRRAPRRRPGPARPGGARLRVDHRAFEGSGEPACQGPDRLQPGGRLQPRCAGAQRRGPPARARGPV
ncbi:MAG: Deacetylases, including yeast histone deacetylase and acetoin utilization protein, partial [uncultured Ramlibacter sp.]